MAAPRKIRPAIDARSSDPTRTVSMTVNGEAVERPVSVRMLLTDFLRHELGLTGTHVGCEHGVCGCCTVIIDGDAARACLTFAVQADGSEIRTIEGLAAADGTLHPVQEAFHACHGLQCGYCTPGFVLSIVNFLEQTGAAELGEAEIRAVLSGNLCRCTGYQNIVAAVGRAAAAMRDTSREEG